MTYIEGKFTPKSGPLVKLECSINRKLLRLRNTTHANVYCRDNWAFVKHFDTLNLQLVVGKQFKLVLSLLHVLISFLLPGIEKPPPDVVDILVQAELYDMAFTVILRFWKGSGLKRCGSCFQLLQYIFHNLLHVCSWFFAVSSRELERVFVAMSLKCCPNRVGPSLVG